MLSTMKSSLCDTVCEEKWLLGLLEEFNQEEMVKCPIEISTHSQSVIDWIKNTRVSNFNKHIARKYHFVKDEWVKREAETNM